MMGVPKTSYSGEITQILNKITTIEGLLRVNTEGKYSESMLDVLNQLRKKLKEVDQKYNQIPKKF